MDTSSDPGKQVDIELSCSSIGSVSTISTCSVGKGCRADLPLHRKEQAELTAELRASICMHMTLMDVRVSYGLSFWS
jgi:hypothetical protein